MQHIVNDLMVRRLHALQHKQAHIRATVYMETEVDELQAIKKYFYGIFGTQGFIESTASELGILYIGYYKDGPCPTDVAGAQSRQSQKALLFRGVHLHELVAQAKVLGLKGGM